MAVDGVFKSTHNDYKQAIEKAKEAARRYGTVYVQHIRNSDKHEISNIHPGTWVNPITKVNNKGQLSDG